ncbi:MAG: hypothetical protein MZV49_22280 [Rhodopseudomonas palustris]|nr:hypothetical protein [Rhodopseudomonas palustris]
MHDLQSSAASILVEPAGRRGHRCQVREQVMAVVRAHFRPEFLNRVDEIILFHRLQRARHGRHRRDPARPAAASCSTDRKITLELDDAARELARRDRATTRPTAPGRSSG